MPDGMDRLRQKRGTGKAEHLHAVPRLELDVDRDVVGLAHLGFVYRTALEQR